MIVKNIAKNQKLLRFCEMGRVGEIFRRNEGVLFCIWYTI